MVLAIHEVDNLETNGVSTTIFKKALIQMDQQIRILEKTVTFMVAQEIDDYYHQKQNKITALKEVIIRNE